jgi:hypothetical protein
VSRGVAVDYYLKAQAETVRLEFLDAAGQVVRAVEGRTEEKPEAEEEPTGFGPPPPPKVTTKAGMNRYVWDMRYEGAAEFEGQILWWTTTRGPRAAPGRYRVRLIAGGETREQPFAVLANPNVPSMTDADYKAQFQFAKQVRDRFHQANQTVIWIRAIKADIAERVEKANDAAVTKAADALRARLEAIEGEIYQRRAQANQDVLNYGVRLNNKFGVLQVSVESADAVPTDSARTVFADLSKRLDSQLAALDTALSADLGAFNKLLAGKKLPAVDPTRQQPAPASGVPQ